MTAECVSVFGELWLWTRAAGGSLLCRDLWPPDVFARGALRLHRTPAGRQQAVSLVRVPVSRTLERRAVERGVCVWWSRQTVVMMCDEVKWAVFVCGLFSALRRAALESCTGRSSVSTLKTSCLRAARRPAVRRLTPPADRTTVSQQTAKKVFIST